MTVTTSSLGAHTGAVTTSTGMTEDTELLALHQTMLVSWAVRAFGRALLNGTGAAILVVIVAAAASSDVLMLLSPAIGFLGFALTLAYTHAPVPLVTED